MGEMKAYSAKRKAGTFTVMCPYKFILKEVQSYDKTIVTLAESEEHAKQKLKEDHGGEWEIEKC